MKKLFLFFTILLLSIACIFAHVNDYIDFSIDSEEDSKLSGLFFDVGRAGFPTSQLNLANDSSSIEQLWGNNTFVEFGKFKSSDTGFIDWVALETVGFGYGKINTAYNYFFTMPYNGEWTATDDANVLTLTSRGSFGLQISFLSFSAGAMLGLTSYANYKSFDAINDGIPTSSATKYYGCDFGVTFTPGVYLSLNLSTFAKIMVLYNVDLPIFTAKYAYAYAFPYNLSKWGYEWFTGDVPTSVMIGAILFL